MQDVKKMDSIVRVDVAALRHSTERTV